MYLQGRFAVRCGENQVDAEQFQLNFSAIVTIVTIQFVRLRLESSELMIKRPKFGIVGQRVGPGDQLGFSIVELMFVGGLIAILGAMAVPQMQQSLTSYRLTSSANLVSSELSAGRALAVSRNWLYEVELDTGSHTIQIIDPNDAGNSPRSVKFLESGIVLQSVPTDRIRFYSRGHARGGTVVLQDQNGDTISVVVNASGKVEIG